MGPGPALHGPVVAWAWLLILAGWTAYLPGWTGTWARLGPSRRVAGQPVSHELLPGRHPGVGDVMVGGSTPRPPDGPSPCQSCQRRRVGMVLALAVAALAPRYSGTAHRVGGHGAAAHLRRGLDAALAAGALPLAAHRQVNRRPFQAVAQAERSGAAWYPPTRRAQPFAHHRPAAAHGRGWPLRRRVIACNLSLRSCGLNAMAWMARRPLSHGISSCRTGRPGWSVS